jgi:hypothetical protein
MSCSIKANTIDFLKDKNILDRTRKVLLPYEMNSYNDSLTKRAFEKYGVGNGKTKLFTIEKQYLPVGRGGYQTIYRAIANNKLFDILEEAVANAGKYNVSDNEFNSPQIDMLFKEVPELFSIGTTEQYSMYLDSIFPNSEVKDIVYHGTANPVKIEEFKISRDRLYFTDMPTASGYAAWDQFNREQSAGEEGYTGETLVQVIPAIINLENPVYLDNVNFRETETNKEGDGIIGTNIVDPLHGNETQYVIRNTNQVHILGNQQDLNNFEKYVANNLDMSEKSGIFASTVTQLSELLDNPQYTSKFKEMNINNINDLNNKTEDELGEVIKKLCK